MQKCKFLVLLSKSTIVGSFSKPIVCLFVMFGSIEQCGIRCPAASHRVTVVSASLTECLQASPEGTLKKFVGSLSLTEQQVQPDTAELGSEASMMSRHRPWCNRQGQTTEGPEHCRCTLELCSHLEENRGNLV